MDGVLPAQERLDSQQEAIGEADQGLVVQHQLLLLDGPLQLPLGDEGRLHVVAGGDGDGAGLGVLGSVHRAVGVVDEVVQLVAGLVGDGDAHGGGDPQLLRADLDRSGDGLNDSLGDGLGGAGRQHVGAEHQELVTADAHDGVPGPYGCPKSVGHLHEELIADVVPVGVVDVLEAIEIDEQHAGVAEGVWRPFTESWPPVELLPVRQPGERVEVGQLTNRLPQRAGEAPAAPEADEHADR